MDKYQVLLILIVYFIIVGVTSTVFGLGNFSVPDQPTSTTGFDTWSVVISFIGGGLFCTIPGLAGEIRFIVALPFWLMLMYFIYLNLPKTAIGSTPQP